MENLKKKKKNRGIAVTEEKNRVVSSNYWETETWSLTDSYNLALPVSNGSSWFRQLHTIKADT